MARRLFVRHAMVVLPPCSLRSLALGTVGNAFGAAFSETSFPAARPVRRGNRSAKEWSCCLAKAAIGSVLGEFGRSCAAIGRP